MNKFFIALLWLGVSVVGMAQKFSIKGQVTDTLASPLPAATIMILNPKDSSLVNFGVSDYKGMFEIKNVSKGSYQLKITFVGYVPFIKNFTTPEGVTEVQFGAIKMQTLTKELAELVIKGEKAPVTVKRDTIEFNASSFKVKANANVEDLLKRMPGMEVETDGTVRAQGEQVQRVTVDGREFFGRDPKLATRNLPADAVEKVQVFDRKSDQAAFTGIEDGQREKTINLELKEDKRNGAFGNMMAGVGTNDRFQAQASINRFSKNKQISVLGMGNNINEQGFSISDFMNFTGGTQQMMGGGRVNLQFDGNNTNGVPLNFGGRQNGIMTNYAGGVNFNQDLSKKTKLSSSYFYSRLDQNISRDINRINYLPADPNNPGLPRSYNFDQQSSQLSNSDNHRVNLTLDHQIDSANSIRFTANASYAQSEQNTSSQSQTMTITNALQNDNTRATYNQQDALTINSNLLYRHRFPKKGRNFSTNLTLGVGQTDAAGNLLSTNQFFTRAVEKQELAQINSQLSENRSYGATLTYTEPLGGRKYLEASYSYNLNRNEVDRDVFNQANGVTSLEKGLTSDYVNDYIYNRPGFNFRMNRQKYNLTVGASYQQTELKGLNNYYQNGQGELVQQPINRIFNNVLPVARINYDFSTFKHLRFDYETAMQEPSIQQLQPIIDNSDPLNISVGNPDLKPAYAHRFSTNFTTFDPAKFVNFFALINATYTTNAFSSSQSVDQRLVRTTKPVNVDDNFNLRGNFNVGFPVKKLNSRFNLGPTVSYTQTFNVLNEQENATEIQTLGGTARYNYTFKEILTIDLSANLSHQVTTYDFNQEDQTFFNKTYTAESNLTIRKNYQLNGSFNYLIYDSRTTNFNQSIPLLNLSVSRFLLKNNTGELRLGVNNLLDKNLSISQTATANYLQQERTNNLGRFLMVSFTYALNKQLNPMGGMRRGGVGPVRMIMTN